MSKNFKTYLTNTPVQPILDEVAARPDLWNQHTFRTEFPGGPFNACSDIICQYNNLTLNPINWLETVMYPAMLLLPSVRQAAHAIMFALKRDRLGRVMVTKLSGEGARIAPHKDDAKFTAYFDRFHLCLQDNPDTVFRCGGEEYRPSVGEVFWFDNSQEHEVINNGSNDRLTMIVDLKKPVLKAFYGPDEQEPKAIAAKTRVVISAIDPTVTYQRETFASLIPELKVLTPLHWKENAGHQDQVPLDVNWAGYLALETQGLLHVYTVRKAGELKGYHISFIGGHLHYQSTNYACVDIYWTTPGNRKQGIGTEFFKAVEESWRSLGVRKVLTGCKVSKPHIEFFESMGYKHSDYMFTKLLEPLNP